jgi:hypothetical protein
MLSTGSNAFPTTADRFGVQLSNCIIGSFSVVCHFDERQRREIFPYRKQDFSLGLEMTSQAADLAIRASHPADQDLVAGC